MVKFANAASWLLGLLAAAGRTSILVRAANNIVPGAFIIEFADDVDIDEEMIAVQRVATPHMKLNYTLFKGASIRFDDIDTAPQQMQLLSSSAAVKRMWPMRMYNVPTHTVHWTAGEFAASGETTEGVMQKRQATTDTFSPHVMTQVDRLRDQGVVGKGIKVAVVDTGVDYLHPALGGCFGPGCLVGFGYDLVGDAYTGNNNAIPDPDPMDCAGHGSHVSGIIAAQTNNPYGIIGAATGVTMGHFRVFGCEGSAADDVLIAAFNMAYDAGADIISASIGSFSGWDEEAWAVAASRIVANGVVCTISAGNDGSDGLFSASSASTGNGVVAVASVDNRITPSLFVNGTYTAGGGVRGSFGFVPGQPGAWANSSLPLFAISKNTSVAADACSPLPSNTPNLSGYAVLVRRGTCTFAEKLSNVAKAGARNVIVYNNLATGSLSSISADPGSSIVATAMVDAEQGASWIAALSTGQNVTVSMPDPNTGAKYVVAPVNNVTGGYSSTFTSWGPTFEVELKPQVGSPGGNILSTYPRAMGSYAVLSGTSMACPLVAGIYALLMNVRGTKDPKMLQNLLSSTANPNAFNDGNATVPIIAPASQQGAGLVQAFDAAYATTELGISSLSFNDTDNMVKVQNFSIANNSNRTISYTLRHVGAATGYTLSNQSLYPSAFPNELHSENASITFGVDNPFTLAAGERKIVSVTCTPPIGLVAQRLPVYSGYIVINGSDSSGLSIPYIGVFGSLKSATVMAKSSSYLTSSRSGPNTSSIAAGRTFMLPPPGRSNDTQFQPNITDYPVIQFSMAMGSPLVRIDVVPISVPPNANITESLGLRTLGDVWMTPLPYQARNTADAPFTINWDGRMSTGDYAPAGTYKMVMRALKILGDKNNEADYEVLETVEFGIQYMRNGSISTATGPMVRAE
ncbi:hypothetical protein N0V93_005297 [Gnomoniopsis smithogilvyi]|uniref:Uncharacterized protein n=1 Tax=Gnomoniopsis smithogilvyi TaxID=1191159 RepID=A0A9W8YU46_9PEZI|nr:hypothetical protein N0V93_005297 [Gnomoniopsis smithogilvyi]